MNEATGKRNSVQTAERATSGPWEVSGAYVVADQHETIICQAWSMSNPKVQVDMRLIASAPDLLAALIALEQAYSNKHSPQHRAACLAEARSVIAKATGGNDE